MSYNSRLAKITVMETELLLLFRTWAYVNTSAIKLKLYLLHYHSKGLFCVDLTCFKVSSLAQGNYATYESSGMCPLITQYSGMCQSGERKRRRPLYTVTFQV